MTTTLIILAGLGGLFCFFAGCIVGHRTARQEGSDSANRWVATYAGGYQPRPGPPGFEPAPPSKNP